jgi:hypothetical protein
VSTGHWQGAKLVLQSRREGISAEHAMTETISLSDDGRVMKRSFHPKDGNVPDYEILFEKISETPGGVAKPSGKTAFKTRPMCEQLKDRAEIS